MPPWSKGWQAAQDFVLSRDNRTSLNNRSPSATRFGSRSTESGSGVMGSCGAELETSTPVLQTFAGCCAATGKLSAKSMADRAKLPSFRLFILPHAYCPRLTPGCAWFVSEPGQNIHLPLSKKNRVGFEIVGFLVYVWFCSALTLTLKRLNRFTKSRIVSHSLGTARGLKSCRQFDSIRPYSL